MSYERLKCQMCGEGFYAKTIKAKFCSNSCKQKDYRKRREQNGPFKKATLTFDEYAFVRAVCEVDHSMGHHIQEALAVGDLTFVKALYEVTRYPEWFQAFLDSGLRELFPAIIIEQERRNAESLELPF